MKILASATVLLLLATPVAAQSQDATAPTPQASSVSDLTRALNGGPPFVAPTPAPTPTPVPVADAAPAVVPTPARITTTPTPAVTRPTAVAAPAAAPTPSVPDVVTPAEPAAPAYRPLDPAARAALPFRLDLPQGFELDTGRPGPDFTIYSVRREGTPFVMIYAGPASQFPIYDGQMAEVAGRVSVVVTEADGRHALEHLFQRAAAPREIHVWVASLDPADRAVAERIAQSVDLR